jgi:WD repeat-containing protein 19
MCSCFGWDKDGDLLAIVTDKSPNLIIWDAHSDSGKEQLIDTSEHDVVVVTAAAIVFDHAVL